MSNTIYSNNLQPLYIIDQTDKYIICSGGNNTLFTFSISDKNKMWYESLEDLIINNGLLAKEIQDKICELKYDAEVLSNLKETFVALIKKEFSAEVLSIKLKGVMGGSEASDILLAIANNLEIRLEKILNDFNDGNFDFYYEAQKSLKLK